MKSFTAHQHTRAANTHTYATRQGKRIQSYCINQPHMLWQLQLLRTRTTFHFYAGPPAPCPTWLLASLSGFFICLTFCWRNFHIYIHTYCIACLIALLVNVIVKLTLLAVASCRFATTLRFHPTMASFFCHKQSPILTAKH